MESQKTFTTRAARLLLTALILCPLPAFPASVSEYRVFFAELYTNENRLARIALRRFRMDGGEWYLAVGPASLRTDIVPVGKYRVLRRPLARIIETRRGLPYVRALRYAEMNSLPIKNAGIRRIDGAGSAVYLTADLCPSRLPMDRTFISRIISDPGPHGRPVPVAIAMTGKWLLNHQEDARWLAGLAARNEIAATWINHTLTHRHRKSLPWWRNFLLDGDNHIHDEIVGNEAAMIEAGMVPSAFFRFPGLVSNHAVFSAVTGHGLIPVGSDAWLGKKQWPRRGSIVLVHINGLEPVGIRRFLLFLDQKRGEFAAGRWVPCALADGVSRMMKMY